MGTDHDKPDIRSALRRAVKAGMVVNEKRNGHRWGTLSCPACDGRTLTIACTPKSQGDMAKRIDEFVRRHTGCGKEEA